jgi:hypothetical protein
MKTIVIFILSSLTGTALSAQNDPRLRERADSILMFTKQINIEKILDFTYPKLFSIVPRDQMVEALKNTFETDELSIGLDSVRLDSIYPVFTIGEARYTKVQNSQVTLMRLKKNIDTADKESVPFFLGLMEDQFGKENVRFDAPTTTLHIRMKSEMIAVKDSHSPEWSFINYKEDDETLLPSLFSKEVLEKFKSIK